MTWVTEIKSHYHIFRSLDYTNYIVVCIHISSALKCKQLGRQLYISIIVKSSFRNVVYVKEWSYFIYRQKREDIVVATKVRFSPAKGGIYNVNDQGLSRRHIVKACEDSLSRLQTDYIDLYQVLI